jgi:hypothetical protein
MWMAAGLKLILRREHLDLVRRVVGIRKDLLALQFPRARAAK